MAAHLDWWRGRFEDGDGDGDSDGERLSHWDFGQRGYKSTRQRGNVVCEPCPQGKVGFGGVRR